jgi:hypothetical protein
MREAGGSSGGGPHFLLEQKKKQSQFSDISKNQRKRPRTGVRCLFDFILAATHVPTQLPVQDHRPGGPFGFAQDKLASLLRRDE